MGKRGQRGWSMSETVLVVGIVAVLGAGVLSKFSATARQASVSAAAQDVKLIAGAVEAAYSYKSDFAGLSSETFLPMAPDGLKRGGCKTACKTFQVSGVISVQKLPPWVV